MEHRSEELSSIFAPSPEQHRPGAANGDEKIMSTLNKPFAAVAIALALFSFGTAAANASPNGWGKPGIFADAFRGD